MLDSLLGKASIPIGEV